MNKDDTDKTDNRCSPSVCIPCSSVLNFVFRVNEYRGTTCSHSLAASPLDEIQFGYANQMRSRLAVMTYLLKRHFAAVIGA